MWPELEPRHYVWRAMLFGQRVLMLRMTAQFKNEFGLTVPQFEALLTLRDSEGQRLPSAALARTLLYSSGSTTHLVDRLEERGLVRRGACDSDARIVEVSLTPEGRTLIDAAATAHLATIDELFSPAVAEDELPALLGFSHRLVTLTGLTDDAEPRLTPSP